MDVESLCKICFQRGDSLNDNSINIIKEIYECFQITLLYEKNKPCSICKGCLKDLNNAKFFRYKCFTTDERFSNYYAELLEKNMVKREIDDDIINQFDKNSHESNKTSIVNANVNKMLCTAENEDGIDKSINNYKCNICKKILKTKTSLLKHYVSMHEKRKHIGRVSGFGKTRRYHCTACSYSTPHSQTLVNHMRRHNGERPYRCDCGRSFTQSSSLAAHRKTHSNTTYFTCTLCGKQFKHAFAMKNHLRVHESGSFSCRICFKTLKSKQSLQAHMRRHYNICNYNCEDCGDTFVTSSELLNHRRKHSSEKTIECHLCGYKTHTKKNLIIHLKR